MSKNRRMTLVLTGLLLAGLMGTAFAWGPRAQLAIVDTALQLLSREKNVELTRLKNDIRAGASISNIALEELYPEMLSDPLRALENEMALLSAAKGPRVNAYFAWRLGALGKLVARLTMPMGTADPAVRGQYQNDVEPAIGSVNLTPAARNRFDNLTLLERAIREANSVNDLIESEYQGGVGFRGAASARLSNDASRSVNAVADVWWTILTSRAVPGNISDEQLRRYVVSAFDFYIERGNLNEIEDADKHYSGYVAYTPDMRARIGDMLYAAGFRERAIKEYEAVLAASPERRDIVEKIGAYYAERAEESLEKNLLEEALEGFKKALAANGLHPTAELRRLEVETLIRRRDEQQAQYQAMLKQAEDLRDLAEDEAQRTRYAEAIALLQQAESTFTSVGDEFPMESQRRTRGLRDVQHRLSELKQSLLGNALAFSGVGFGPDMDMILDESAKGLEREALGLLLEQAWKHEMQRLSAQIQAVVAIE